MAEGTDLQLSITAYTNGFTQGLQHAQSAARAAAQSMRNDLGNGLRGATEASNSFESKVRTLKGEMASGDRTVNFFARSLNNIVPEASAAGQGLRLLADGLIGGIGLGFALQGVMAVMTLFGDKLKETEKAAQESAKAAKVAAEEWYQVGAQFEAAMAKIGAPKKSWQREQVDTATAGTDKQIEEKEKRLREVDADLNQALRDRDNVGLVDNGADERVVAALTEKEALKETLEALRATREQQRAAAAERAEQVAAGLTDTSTAITYYQETGRLQGEATKKRIEDKERLEKESQARIDKLWWDNFHAQVAAEQKLLDAQEAILGKEMSAYYQNVLGGQYGNTKFAGTVDVPSLGYSKGIAAGAEILGAASQDDSDRDAALKKRNEELVGAIATEWTNGLLAIAETTKSFTDLMRRVFAQMMQALMAELLPAKLGAFAGPLGAIGGFLLGKALPRAHGGWDIPKGLGEVPMIGRGGEMMLAEPEADVVRSLARRGGAGGGLTVNVSAFDGRSVERVFVDNDGAIQKAMRKSRRRGRA